MLNKLHFQYPANLQKASKHRLAARIFKGQKQQILKSEVCECCGKRVGVQHFQMAFCYNPIEQLIFLGPGVPLLFIFIQNSLILFLNATVIFIGYALISNILGSSCEQDTVNCIQNFLNKLSISNKINNLESLTIQTYLILASIIIFIPLVQFLLIRIRRVNQKCDRLIDSPSDYSIIISNLPQNVTQRDIVDMIQHERTFLDDLVKQQTDNLSINHIVISYSLSDYLKQFQQEKQEFLKIKKNNINIPLLEKHIQKPTKSSNFAIVVFNRQSSKQKFIQRIRCTKQLRNFFCNGCLSLGSFRIKDTYVQIKRAPEPDDIYWPNSNQTRFQILRNQILIHFVCIIILCLGGGIQYLIFFLQFKKNRAVDFKFQFSWVSSILIVIFNQLIAKILTYLTQKQGTYLRSQMYQSLLIKISVYQLFNAGIFPILARIVAIDRLSFNIQGDFTGSIVSFMALNGIIPNIFNLLKTKLEIPNSIIRYFLKKGCFQYTQYQANKLYQLPHVNFPLKYSYIIKTVWLTYFFSPFSPIVVPISILSLTIFYVVQSYLFKSSYNAPKMLDIQISKIAMKLLMYSSLLLSLGQTLIMVYIKYFTQSQININEWIPIFLCLIFAIITVLIPSYVINKRLFQIEKADQTFLNYEEVKDQFQITYQDANPLNQSQAIHKRNQNNFLRFIMDKLTFLQEKDYTKEKNHENQQIEIQLKQMKYDNKSKNNEFKRNQIQQLNKKYQTQKKNYPYNLSNTL